MNLLIICIDRYLSVTFPVKYRNKRKVLHAKLAMLFAWVVSFVLWAPWIIGWQYIVKLQGRKSIKTSSTNLVTTQNCIKYSRDF